MKNDLAILWLEEVQRMARRKVYITILSIVMGLIVGAIVLLLAGYNPIEAYRVMFQGAYGSPRFISWTIIRSTPIILTGISIAFAFKTGLFNIGAEGQFIIGALFAALAGYFFNLPPILHGIAAILVGSIAAAIWGALVGFLKAKSGINEVITSIMLNWIALYLNNWFLTFESFRRPNSDTSYYIQDSARIGILQQWKLTDGGREYLAGNDFLREFLNPPVNFGFILAILVAIAIWYILKNTTLGYQLKAVGYNRDASEFAGINVNKNMILAMAIAGGIAGLAGALQTTGVSFLVSLMPTSPGFGFDGIAVALIAALNPLATIPAGLLFGGMVYGGSKLTSFVGAPSEIINITLGVIVFFVAMPKLYEITSSIFKRGRGVKHE